jgi:hypothetical protein
MALAAVVGCGGAGLGGAVGAAVRGVALGRGGAVVGSAAAEIGAAAQPLNASASSKMREGSTFFIVSDYTSRI